MSLTLASPTRSPVGGEGSEEVVHLACCRDADRGLCGQDLAGHAWVSPSDGPVCWVCDGLDGGRCIKVFGRWLRCVARR